MDIASSYGAFQQLIGLEGTATSSSSDFHLIQEIINLLAENKTMTIEELAEQTGVSPATISRFVKKCGFTSYRDFHMKFFAIQELSRSVRSTKYDDNSDLISLDPIHRNLESTRQHLDIPLIRRIIRLFCSLSNRYFIGTTEDLITLSCFHKDLVTMGYSAHLFYDISTQFDILAQACSRDVFMMTTVDNDFARYFYPALEKAKGNGATLILFTQTDSEQDDAFSRIFDVVYHYGIPDSANFGSYSERYLASVLSHELRNNLYNEV